MAVGSVMQNALSGLLVNQTALSVTSNNISNVNNPDYVRRQVVQQERVLGGQGAGVEVAEIRRVADQFLSAQSLSATTDAARYQAVSDLHDRVQSLLGDPSSTTAIAGQIDQLFASFSALTVDPTSSANRSAAVSQLNQTFAEFGRVADGLANLRVEADQRIADDVSSANGAIQQIDKLNKAIQSAQASGAQPSDLLDQRDAAVKQLAQLMDVRTVPQANGRIGVLTGDGTQLVGDGYVQLAYQPGAPGSAAGAITAYPVNSLTGAVGTTGVPIDGHIASGEIRGLMDMRDQTLPDLSASLGELAGTLADGLNAVQNDSTPVPPPSVLSGRQTGLLGSDDAGFTGRTTIAVVDAAGALVRRVDVDFDAGTVATDGATPVALGGDTLADVVSGINRALGDKGSASFTGGVLTLQAAGGNGVALHQDADAPSDRGGRGFAQFFGLNDLVRTGNATNFDTGLSPADTSGFAAGQDITLRLTKPDGTSLERTVAIGGGSFADALAALNDPATGFGSGARFALDADGALSVTPGGSYQGATLQVVNDQTARGDTGVSFSNLFGLSDSAKFGRAADMTLGAAIGNGSGIGTARLALDDTTRPGATVLVKGDTSGAVAVQTQGNRPLSFKAAGQLGAVSRSAGQYASDLLSLSGSMANQAHGLRDSRNAVKSEVDQQMASVSGVNLDEELVNMMTYQKAYSASARLIQVADQMMQDLLGLVGN